MSIVDRISRLLVVLLAWGGLVFLALPLVIIVATSFTETEFLKFPPVGFTLRWYWRFLADSSYLGSIWTSVAIAGIATVIAVVLGVLVALVISRSEIRGRQLLNTIFIAPLILPTIVIGAALLQYANALGFARSFFALVVGHTVIVVPYVLRTVLASLERFDKSLEEASHDLGGNAVSTFFLITLPIIKPGLVAGALFAFIISWSQYLLTLLIGGGTVITLPVLLFSFANSGDNPITAALSIVFIAPAMLFLLFTARFLTGRSAALGGFGKI